MAFASASTTVLLWRPELPVLSFSHLLVPLVCSDGEVSLSLCSTLCSHLCHVEKPLAAYLEETELIVLPDANCFFVVSAATSSNFEEFEQEGNGSFKAKRSDAVCFARGMPDRVSLSRRLRGQKR